LQTEITFIQDMHVLNDHYAARTQDCPLLSPRQKQIIFGRIKGLLSFGDTFQRELTKAAGDYANLSERQILDARFDELLDWDAETSIGETFWSSVRYLTMGLTTDGEDREGLFRILYTSRRGIADPTRSGEE
jgi:hypothetical protein